MFWRPSGDSGPEDSDLGDGLCTCMCIPQHGHHGKHMASMNHEDSSERSNRRTGLLLGNAGDVQPLICTAKALPVVFQPHARNIAAALQQ